MRLCPNNPARQHKEQKQTTKQQQTTKHQTHKQKQTTNTGTAPGHRANEKKCFAVITGRTSAATDLFEPGRFQTNSLQHWFTTCSQQNIVRVTARSLAAVAIARSHDLDYVGCETLSCHNLPFAPCSAPVPLPPVPTRTIAPELGASGPLFT